MLRQGKRIMTMRQGRGGCRYLGSDDRCTIYSIRPLGCRAFPFDPTFKRDGTLRRLKLIEATECPYELDGQNDVDAMRQLHERYDAATDDYQQKVAEWNRLQRRRRRQGKAAQTSREFLRFPRDPHGTGAKGEVASPSCPRARLSWRPERRRWQDAGHASPRTLCRPVPASGRLLVEGAGRRASTRPPFPTPGRSEATGRSSPTCRPATTLPSQPR